MNMMLVPVRTVRVSGTVADSTGQPLQGGFVNVVVRLGIGPMGANYGSPVKPDGTFSIAGVAPGDYVLHLGSNNNAGKGEAATICL